jgi:hypothetical protein
MVIVFIFCYLFSNTQAYRIIAMCGVLIPRTYLIFINSIYRLCPSEHSPLITRKLGILHLQVFWPLHGASFKEFKDPCRTL